jgi:hypothetical protein
MIVIASLFRGYTAEGKYTDTPYNLAKAHDIAESYWLRDEPAIALVLMMPYLQPPYSDRTNEQALRWCLHFVEHADELHCHYPREMGLSSGMRGEAQCAFSMNIPVKYKPWEVW